MFTHGFHVTHFPLKLMAEKPLSLKTNFVLFHHPPQKTSPSLIKLNINQKPIEQRKSINYLGILIDSNLNWKHQIVNISKKIKRSVGVYESKIRYYVNRSILIQLYYSFVYPILTYGITVWGNTYNTTLNPIITLQKKAIRIITFSIYNAHTHSLFKENKIIKLHDLIFLYNALFMYDYYTCKLSPAFSQFFIEINKIHNHNTRLASKKTFYLPAARTNYGKFSKRFQGVKIWNSIEEKYKSLKKYAFKQNLKSDILDGYWLLYSNSNVILMLLINV